MSLTSDVGPIKNKTRLIDVRHMIAFLIVPRIVYNLSTKLQKGVLHDHLGQKQEMNLNNSIERICPSRGGIGRIRSRFDAGVRSFLRNRSVRNGGVLGESSTYFRGILRRLSTGQKWDWHMPDAC